MTYTAANVTKIETYLLTLTMSTLTQTRQRSKQATKVMFDDGCVIRFVEKMSKREAIHNALYQRNRHPEHLA